MNTKKEIINWYNETGKTYEPKFDELKNFLSLINKNLTIEYRIEKSPDCEYKILQILKPSWKFPMFVYFVRSTNGDLFYTWECYKILISGALQNFYYKPLNENGYHYKLLKMK